MYVFTQEPDRSDMPAAVPVRRFRAGGGAHQISYVWIIKMISCKAFSVNALNKHVPPLSDKILQIKSGETENG